MKCVIKNSTVTLKAHLGSDKTIIFCFLNLISFFLMIERFLEHFAEQMHVYGTELNLNAKFTLECFEVLACIDCIGTMLVSVEQYSRDT